MTSTPSTHHIRHQAPGPATSRTPRGFQKSLVWLALSAFLLTGLAGAEAPSAYRSPQEIRATPSGDALYLVEVTGQRVDVIDPSTRTVTAHIDLPGPPGGLALSPDGGALYVTRASPDGAVWVINPHTATIVQTIQVGHTPVAAVASPDGKTLFVCNQFTHDVSVVDLAAAREIARIPVRREPVAAVLTRDGRRLLVANLLPTGPANGAVTAADVTIIDATTHTVLRQVALPNGSHSVQGIAISPDGGFAYLTHILSRYQVPTTQLERGWMNTNALSILDLAEDTYYNTVLLDDVDRGAANPWALALSADGRYLCVTHAGTHELSIIQREQMHDKLERLRRGEPTRGAARTFAEVPNDLAFLSGLRRRIPLPARGPRGLALLGDTAYVTGYFSDSVSVVPLAEDPASPSLSIALGPTPDMDTVRRGEYFFHDASRCFQQWHSCVSCHPGVRADALNWDLLNDGIGNPKNTKSLLLAHQTPPAMSSGIRDSAETAVRAGIRHIEFAVWPEQDAAAIDAYLRSLAPTPSPYLVDGALSEAAQRGKWVFAEVGCVTCHPPPLYTDLSKYDVHTGIGREEHQAWDTPTLVESWRTAPYLHDGRSATLEDLFFTERHGVKPDVQPQDLNDLIQYVKTL